ncbi:MAG: T9SS type A sorting domain-containing protein [Bacteroidota bacterium]|nr:MAG: T9SS type A sorting domain-containing protein [Bacteroidota bacterium]
MSNKPSDADISQTMRTGIQWYPNPCQSSLIVEINSPENQSLRLDIFDLSGRLVKEVHTELRSGANKLEVDTRSLSAGMYTLQVWNKGLLQHRARFSKQD